MQLTVPVRLTEAADAMRARPIGDISGDLLRICTDTRDGIQRSLFFALKGENADGHRFVRQAFEGGAAAAVVQRFVEDGGLPQLIVSDPLVALGDLAQWYRGQFQLPIIGITGSVGKTSTREMVAHALRARFTVLTSEQNFNNEIGVPKTLFELDKRQQACVLEMGMRGSGQIARLAAIAAPRVGVITNIGLSHVELLGSREAIAAAKAELLEALPSDGAAVINAEDQFADYLAGRTRAKVITYGTAKTADFRATHARFTEAGEPRFRLNGVPARVNAPGVHHVVNACAAAAVGSVLGLTVQEVAAQLETYRPPAMRMETIELPDGTTILNDAYNAAPDSMRSALETLALMAGSRRRAVAVLGDMKELGQESEAGHRYVGEQAAARKPGLLITVGKMAEWTAEAASALGKSRIHRFADTESAAAGTRELTKPGDLVLIKGSRAMAMERIVDALTKGNERKRKKK